jgi:uncharacterized protein (DUF1697 family)
MANRRRSGRLRPYAAFLRGVLPTIAKNEDLRRCFEDAGFEGVKTVLVSGNVVFLAPEASPSALEKKADAAMQERLGRTFAAFVRPIDRLEEILATDPYAGFGIPADAKRVVTFFRTPPKPIPALPVEEGGARILCVDGHEAYTAYVRVPNDAVFMRLIKATFGDEVTTRTWESVTKVARAGAARS